MKLKVKHYKELTLDELHGIYRYRMSVFVVEQICPYQEVDDNDNVSCICGWITGSSGIAVQRLQYLPYGEDWVDIQINLDPSLGQYTFNGKEKDWESGFHYYGARYYWSEVLTGWLSVDPMADKYPNISPYAYCAWNPMTLVDPDGKELSPNPYMIFNGNTHTLQIWDDNNTPDNFSDDLFLGQFNAGNNVSPRDNPAGNWEDGIYPMEDTQETHKHTDEGGNPITEVRGGQKIPVDSELGAYGVLGIFRAKKFTQEDGVQREGMGVHSGRGVTDANVDKSYTRGCIRTTPEAMDAIVGAIKEFGALTNIIVQCNRTSSKSPQTNTIFPGHGLPHYVLNEINIIETTK